MALKYISRFIVVVLFAISAVIGSAQPILAFNGEADYDFFENSNFRLYDPADIDCGSDLSSSLDDSNRGYNGKLILSSTQVNTVKGYRTIYETAADKYDVPWQLIAAIHLHETGLQLQNPPDGTGPYRDVSSPYYRPGALSVEDFKTATDKVASILHTFAESKSLKDIGGIDAVKSIVFKYTTNSASLATAKNLYIQQAKTLKFTDEQAARGEGSPDVMNRADAARDSTSITTSSSWGWVPPNKTALSYPATGSFGIVVLYAALAGINLATNECTGGLVAGGMDLKQAIVFMDHYKTNADSIKYIGGAGRGCPGGPLSNCVSFSVYFINKFTTIQKMGAGWSPGNGSGVVANIIARNPDIKHGTVPQPYAIFSTASGSMLCDGVLCGHTGVILGVDTDRGKVIVGEAGCGAALSWDTAREYSIERFSNGTYKYAYTSDILKEQP